MSKKQIEHEDTRTRSVVVQSIFFVLFVSSCLKLLFYRQTLIRGHCPDKKLPK